MNRLCVLVFALFALAMARRVTKLTLLQELMQEQGSSSDSGGASAAADTGSASAGAGSASAGTGSGSAAATSGAAAASGSAMSGSGGQSTSPSTGGTTASNCVSRDSMIARAKTWVAAHVPYNQGALHDGYREDCSGYVSYCWQLPAPGMTTSTLGSVSTQIDKSALQPGDILLNAATHVVIFGGWVGTSQTQYIAFEETRPGEGTVSRPTPYPYWNDQSAYVPRRFNHVC